MNSAHRHSGSVRSCVCVCVWGGVHVCFLTYLRAQVVDLSLEPLAGLLNLLLPGEEEQQVPLHLLAHVDLTKIYKEY